MNEKKYFKGAEEFSVLCDALATVIAVLNLGRTGETPAAIHASRKGYRITVAGKTVCTGKTPRELHDNFAAEAEKAKRADPV